MADEARKNGFSHAMPQKVMPNDGISENDEASCRFEASSSRILIGRS